MGAKYDKSFVIAKVLRRVPPLAPVARRYNDWRHGRIRREIEPLLRETYEGLDSIREPPALTPMPASPVWLFWWQGEAAAPASVRSCFESVRRNAWEREVIVLDRDNLGRYVQFSERVWALVDAGVVTLTHFSDLLRYRLLRVYGGLWMDASLYAARPIPDLAHGEVYTMATLDDPTHFNASLGRWCGGLMGGPARHPHFAFMDEFFDLYWKRCERLVDYFLIDSAVAFSYERDIGGFAGDCVRAVGREPQMYALRPWLRKPFDEAVWRHLTQDTSILMVNYKWVRDVRPGSFADKLLTPYGVDGGVEA